jgi:hypothetical protein
MSETLRLRASSRAAGALVGAIVTAVGLACIAVYSGRELDLELLGIVILGGAGVWLLLSALAAGLTSARTSRVKGRSGATDSGLDDSSELRTQARDAADAASNSD